MLHTNEHGSTKHINPVQHVKSVPSRRNALIAFDKILEEIRAHYFDLDPEIDMVSDFLKSR